MSKHDNYPILEFKTEALFEKWLEKNQRTEGVWVKIAKANSGIESVNQTEALDVALCYGWIPGLRRGLDENYFIQKFTPRTASSIWSVINKKKVALLIKNGRMKAGGIAAIELAKKNGRWKAAYEGQKNIKVPAQLQEALDQNTKAKAFFEKLSSQNRFSIIFRISQLKREESRIKKIKEFITMLEQHKTIYPQK